jgi:colanic acid/amylovoran biosynthesis glycosyltransferase
MLNVPLVVSFYGYDYDYLIKKSPVWRRRYKKLFAHAAMILTEGEYGRASLIAKGCDPQKVTVQHLGVDTDRIPFKERQYQTDEKLKLIQVARFAEKKGHRIFVEAVKILRDEGLADKLSVLLVGTGPLKEEILSYLHRNDLSDTVHVRDFIPYTQLHIELLSYHALVQPSLTASDSDCEGGAPVTLLDAQASGLPVISTYHCDISEVVLEGITGLLVPEKSSIDLANAIKYVISNPSCISRFSSACREHIRRNYSGERQARRMEEIYQHLIF